MYLFQRLIAINEESLYKMCYYSVNMRILAPLLRFKQSRAKKGLELVLWETFSFRLRFINPARDESGSCCF